MYMQLETTRTENRMQIKRKMKGRDKEIELWLFKKGISTRLMKDIKLQIMEKVKQALQEDTDTNLDNILPLLRSDVQSRIKEPFAKLKQVPMLRGMDEGLLNIIYEKLEPVRYARNSFIIQKGKPLDKMLYIVDGDLFVENRSSDDSRRGAALVYGEELLRWPFYSDFPYSLPLATESVKAIGVVQALALNLRDVQTIYNQSDLEEIEKPRHRKMMKEEMERNLDWWIPRKRIPKKLNLDVKLRIMEKVDEQFQQNNGVYWDTLDWDRLFYLLPQDLQHEIVSYMPLTKLKKVPMLREIDEDVFRIICQKLKPVMYTDNSFIIQKGEQLDKMLYLLDGDVSIEEGSSDDLRRGAGQLCGEELLCWPFSSFFLETLPLATESVKAIGVVEALALDYIDLFRIYYQLDILEKEVPRHRRMMKEEMTQNINGLLRRNGIPERLNQDVKSRFMEELFQENKVVYWDKLDWYHLVSHLPQDFKKEIESYMPLTKLKKMSAFRYMDEPVLKEICNRLQPMKYRGTEDIIEKGDPIQMLFIVEGRIGHQGREKGAGEIYGEELLFWPFSTSFPATVPTIADSPFVITDAVEVLVLTASDMTSVATEFREHFIKNYGRLVQNFRKDTFLRYFTEDNIKRATRNYSRLNYPNEGGYGTVYHTKLDGRDVAIKCNSATGDPFIQSQRLVHEAFVLSKISHKNVVRLFGVCLWTKWPIMVYDRTNALTLFEHFHMDKSKLSLESRMKIAAETAGALAHVHSKSIIHRDVKTANILIDHTTHTVKVTGFGASRLLDEEEGAMEDEVSTLPGTSRYLDLEYLKSHDVYSFGVVLVELLTRQEAVSSNGSETSLANDFVCSVQEDRLDQILDGEIDRDKFSFEMAKKVSELAVKCLRPWGEERPSMEEVAAEIEGVVQTIINWVEPSTVDDNTSAEIEGVVQTIINRVEPSTVDDNISSASRTSE